MYETRSGGGEMKIHIKEKYKKRSSLKRKWNLHFTVRNETSEQIHVQPNGKTTTHADRK